MKIFLTAWAVFIFLLSANAADCPLLVGASDAGWYNAANVHDPANNNYIVGYHTNTMTEYRDWFVFDLPSFASSVTAAELRLFTFGINTPNGMETLELHHVATPITTLVAGAGPGLGNVFNDLADGLLYGMRTVLVAEANSYITISLNSNAVTNLAAAAGQRFAMGGRLSTITPSPANNEVLFTYSSGNAPYVQLALTLAGGNAPMFLQQPPEIVVVKSFQTTNLSVAACGASPLGYQWFFNGSPIAGATNSVYQTPNPNTFPVQGDYFVVVSNAIGRATSSVTHVYFEPEAPVISYAAPEQTVPVGFPVYFFTQLSFGNPRANLQWQFNGVNIPEANSRDFQLSSVQFSNAGTYTLVASNLQGVARTNILLKVEPLIVQSLGDRFVESGNDFYFLAPVDSSVPVTYQWKFYDTNILGANSPYLSIFNVSSSNAGPYSFVAANSYGARTSAVAQLIVQANAPQLAAPFIPNPTLAGSDIIISGIANGSAPIRFQWLFNNSPLPDQTNQQLLLTNLTAANAGQYSLFASNSFGVATSGASSLIVSTQAPFYSTPGTFRQVFIGESVRFSPIISGGPPPAFRWFFNSTEIPGATNLSLLLTNLTIEQSGSYIINASNQAGTTAVGFAINVKPRRALDRWTWRNSRPQANDLKHIAFGNGRAVAAGEGGSVVVSTNGSVWNVVSFGNRFEFTRVTFGNGLFAALAISDESVVFTSADGFTWTAHDLPFAYANSLDFVNGEFLMAGYSLNTPILLARSINCGTWQTEPMAGVTANPISIARGNGFYVAVGSSGLFVSQDSHTWIPRPVPSFFNRVTFVNGRFAVSSYSGAIWTSTDARHWFAPNTGIVPLPDISGDVNGLAYGNGQYVAVGDDGVIVRSSDTITWTPADSTTSKNLRDVVFDGTKFIASGLYGALLTSPNGIAWTDQRGGKTKDLYGIIYTNNQFVAVGYEGTILTSPNGITWTTRTSPNSRDLHALTYGGGQYVAVGRKGTVLTSPNAITWTSRTTPTSNYLQRIAFGNGRFVIAGENGTILSSTDAINWQLHPVSLPEETELEGVAFGKNTFVIVGGYFSDQAHSIILASTNGINWSNVTLDQGVILRGVTFAFNNFLAVGNDGAVNFSGNGLAWTFPSTVAPYENLRNAKLAAGRAVAIGNDGTILSYNLFNWEEHGSIVAHNLHDIAFGANKFVAVGNAGTIVQSDDAQPVFSAVSGNAPAPGGALRFNLRGGMEPEYNLQSSTNLLLWQNEDVFTNDGTSMTFTISTNGPHRFFRTRYP